MPTIFFAVSCQLLKISKQNFIDINIKMSLIILLAHDSTIIFRLTYSVFKLSVLLGCHLAILACSKGDAWKSHEELAVKQLSGFCCQSINVASKFIRNEPLGLPPRGTVRVLSQVPPKPNMVDDSRYCCRWQGPIKKAVKVFKATKGQCCTCRIRWVLLTFTVITAVSNVVLLY